MVSWLLVVACVLCFRVFFFFRGFLIVGHWLKSFLVSKFLGFKVSMFSKIQKSFDVLDRYWFHITKLPFYVFLWVLISYSRFSRSYETDRRDCSAAAFSKIYKIVHNSLVTEELLHELTQPHNTINS